MAERREPKKKQRLLTEDEKVVQSGEESFPASDPPSFSPTISGSPRRGGKSGATVEQLRHDIDSGRTADKVRGRDPSAAPLGTDDEAAGASPDPEEVKRSRQRERK